MEDVYVQHQGKPDTPHMHDYYTILFVEKARGRHLIDFQEYELGGPSVFFISPGQVHQIVEEEPPKGHVITFSRQFLAENNIRECFIEDINLFKDYAQSPPLKLTTGSFRELIELVNGMEDALHSGRSFQYEALGAYLKLFLITCHNICDLSHDSNTQAVEAGLSILRTFKSEVEKHYTHEHQVNFYAGLLSVTPDHLNKTVKSLIGKSAKEYIQSRIITEAKRLLLHSSLTAKEIAYQLGFQDPAHFSKFFKTCTKETVRGFKSKSNP
ncbi:MAG: helix-turn-helix domain-containing protein [Lewinellaceae bacterium]|nr:helix-turn-helix domain-containing protein [Lewinellaceae bacterium]